MQATQRNLNPESLMKAHIKNQFLLPVLTAVLGLMLAGRASAQTFTNLHNFDYNGGFDGGEPHAGLIISGNTLYGAADYGNYVFAININGSGYTNIFEFTGGNYEQSPDGTLLLSGNTLYGTAYYGGTNSYGAVFAVNTNGLGFTNLYSFTATSGVNATNNDGAGPEESLVMSGNTLYGTTENGGTNGYGAMFAVNTDSTGFTNLHSFTGGINGSVPDSLLLSGNILYGVASGFYSGVGTVFKINTNGTDFMILHSFTAMVSPGGLVLSGNTLYGTTYNGGTSGNGTVFAINTDSTGFTNLYNFTATAGSNLTNSDGANPIGGMSLSGNTLYGTAYSGGSGGSGTVFSLNTNGIAFTTLYDFTAKSSDINSDGANPYGTLLLSGNSLYGTTKLGGTNGYGAVFALSLPVPPSVAITTAGDKIILSWPTNAGNFSLQSTTNLSFGNWSNVTSGISTVGTNYIFTNTMNGNVSFFRLKQ